MTDRATCWSITINNPTEEEVICNYPGWKLEGQYEEGENGTKHFQGMLTTNQQRFSAVKKEFPRAHIEMAKNKKALQKYVHKDDTRVAEYESKHVMNMWQAQTLIAGDWKQEDYDKKWKDHVDDRLRRQRCPDDPGDIALTYLDELVGARIRLGHKALEFIAINPMWRSSWKRFYADIITRHASSSCPPSEASSSEAPSP